MAENFVPRLFASFGKRLCRCLKYFLEKKIILKARVKRRTFFKWSLKVDGLAITERFSAIHTEERKLTLVQTNRRKVKKTWHEHDQRKMIPLFFCRVSSACCYTNESK